MQFKFLSVFSTKMFRFCFIKRFYDYSHELPSDVESSSDERSESEPEEHANTDSEAEERPQDEEMEREVTEREMKSRSSDAEDTDEAEDKSGSERQVEVRTRRRRRKKEKNAPGEGSLNVSFPEELESYIKAEPAFDENFPEFDTLQDVKEEVHSDNSQSGKSIFENTSRCPQFCNM